MNRKKMLLVLLTLFAVLFISGCKQNVGTPEDNAVVEEPEEEEDETSGYLYGFCAPDLSDPFYEVLKESVATAADEEGSRMLVKGGCRSSEQSDNRNDKRRSRSSFPLPGGSVRDNACSGGSRRGGYSCRESGCPCDRNRSDCGIYRI